MAYRTASSVRRLRNNRGTKWGRRPRPTSRYVLITAPRLGLIGKRKLKSFLKKGTRRKERFFRLKSTAMKALRRATKKGLIAHIEPVTYGGSYYRPKKKPRTSKPTRFRSRYPGGWAAVVRAEHAEHERQTRKRRTSRRRVTNNGWRRQQASLLKKRRRRTSRRSH